jgi:hypothetical protein
MLRDGPIGKFMSPVIFYIITISASEAPKKSALLLQGQQEGLFEANEK